MCVDTSIASCACQVLVLSVRNVDVCLGVTELFRQTEVDHVHLIRSLAEPHQEVVRLDIAMYEAFAVHVLYAGYLHDIRWLENDTARKVELLACRWANLPAGQQA